ncbi:hypothetical protein N3930_43380, partial [Bacillus thuringiensis]|nr:hypothetical protein [Bacillus thuringiensis]
DHTSPNALDLIALICVHLLDLADALLLSLALVAHMVASMENAGVDAHKGQLAQVRVRGNLEGQNRQRLVITWATLKLHGLVTGLETGYGGKGSRGCHLIDDGV